MQIQLENLVPIPLRDKILQRQSDIWNREVTFTPGSFVKIKAPSGTGKTTLVHYLYHIRYDYTGQVVVDGQSWSTYNKDQISRIRQQQVSVVFQDLRVFEQLTAFENIELKRVMIPTPFCSPEKVQEMAARLTAMRNLVARMEKLAERVRPAFAKRLEPRL